MLRVQNFTVSADGFGSGEGQSLERPFGTADPASLMAWFFPTASFPGRTDGGGTRGIDDVLARDWSHGIGAEIMGANKFSPHRGPWTDTSWQGWWGDEPPFGTPVFVWTHHLRPSFSLGGTTFHFVSGSPAEVLAWAEEAAGGLDVRLGGGAASVRAFLDAGLVDTLHVAVAPVTIGAGSRLWSSPAELEDRYRHEEVASPTGRAVHHLFWR
ncbi:dihydrofolate reductase family protein [Klenkia brasiliensis]|uniref:RibD C-terminal domain-containing protein n=1 Tax=Klenkia brasiliensis TaxID=333142 RepID=A0A1G7SNQ5_9ACTN|nr:dihydrofolate reductase family protein [Klenkia brasiliensis]SDG24695.1 RibD C-terminal domain-containing protein [Klenkia brasiliensis]